MLEFYEKNEIYIKFIEFLIRFTRFFMEINKISLKILSKLFFLIWFILYLVIKFFPILSKFDKFDNILILE
jgi:hypothetical protein